MRRVSILVDVAEIFKNVDTVALRNIHRTYILRCTQVRTRVTTTFSLLIGPE